MRGWGRGRTEQLSGGGAGLGSEVGQRRATGLGPAPAGRGRDRAIAEGPGGASWPGFGGLDQRWHRRHGHHVGAACVSCSPTVGSPPTGDQGRGRAASHHHFQLASGIQHERRQRRGGSEAAPFLYKDRGATQVQADTTGCGACAVLPQASPGLPEGKQGRPAHRSAASSTIKRAPDSPGDCFAVQLWEHRWRVLKCRFLGAGPERKSAALATAP